MNNSFAGGSGRRVASCDMSCFWESGGSCANADADSKTNAIVSGEHLMDINGYLRVTFTSATGASA